MGRMSNKMKQESAGARFSRIELGRRESQRETAKMKRNERRTGATSERL